MDELNAVSMIVDSVGSIYKNTTSVIDDIFSRIEKVKQRNLDSNGIIRSYYFEVLNNLEVLEIINMNKLYKEKPNSKKLISVISRISNEIGTMILFDNKEDSKIDIYGILEKEGKMTKDEDRQKYYDNVLQAMSFTIVKTEILKRMTTFTDEELDLVKDVRIKDRVEHLKERYRIINDGLSELKMIKSFARI